MKLRIMCISIILLMLFSIPAYANSAPLISEKPPGFAIGSSGSTPISVNKEDLQFDLSESKSYTSNVSADYEMKNTSNANVNQTMIFPFVTSMRDDFLKSVSITADGNPVNYKVYRIEDLNIQSDHKSLNYKDNKELKDKISIENIVKMMNKGTKYTPRFFKPDDIIKVYTLHMKENEYNTEVLVNISGNNQKVLCYNVNGYERKNDNSMKFSASHGIKNSKGEYNAYFAVTNEDNEHISSVTGLKGQEITSENITISEFLKNTVVNDITKKYGNEYENDANDYAVKKLDSMLSRNQKFILINESITSAFSSSAYIGAFIYTVNFKPNAVSNVTVKYKMTATIDRRKTNIGVYSFLYLLRPAASWKDFKNLSIKIIPSKENPYVTDSSIPLTKDSDIYTGTLDKLPDSDLCFTMYKTEKVEPIPTDGNVRTISNKPAIIFLVVTGLIISVVAIYFICSDNKNSKV